MGVSTAESTLPSAPLRAKARRAPRRDRRAFDEQLLVGGRYRILKFLGSGGMGEVYEAFDTLFEHTVALKTLRGTYDSVDPADAKSLQREALVARKVTHENVCRVLKFGTHASDDVSQPPLPFIVMELIRGEPLSDYVETKGALSSAKVYQVALQACAGLAAIHEALALHRDIKPENLFVEHVSGNKRRIKVTDFGLARLTGPGTGAITRAPLGTLAYMAPEVLTGNAASPASDVWSMGVTIYQLLTGQLPERDKFGRSRFPCAVPEPWVPVLASCLHYDKNRRYASATQLLSALRAMQSARRSPKRKTTPAQRHGWKLVLLGACVGALAALVMRQTLLPP